MTTELQDDVIEMLHADQRRRQGDTVTGLLADRIDGVQRTADHTADQLTRHVQECAAIQKKVLIGIVFVGTWVVGHSPEASKLFLTIFG